jgi:hypothetical protein
MLSTTKLVSPAPIANRDERSSGSDVQIATIVAPIIIELIPRYTPIFSLFSVKISADFIKKNILAIRTIAQIIICI